MFEFRNFILCSIILQLNLTALWIRLLSAPSAFAILAVAFAVLTVFAAATVV